MIFTNDYIFNSLPQFDRIEIHPSSRDSEVATRVRKLYPTSIIFDLENENDSNQQRGTMSAAEFSQSKRNLLLTTFKGQFFKRCPGATQKKALTCCNYHVLNLGSQCNMNCSYCYLQSYLNSKQTKIFTNIDVALIELKLMADQFSEHSFRVGTGEVIDSLSLDQITLYSRKLIEFFNNYPKWNLEFKTKSNFVDQFLDLKSIGNTIVSWSVNPDYIISKEEHGTANLTDRLAAARKCKDRGYQVAFHIDPIIWHTDWKENYSLLAKEIQKNFSAEEVNIISLGALRFQPEQRHMMRERFGMDSLVTSSEMFPSEGNKLRYDAGLRAEMFQFVIKQFNDQNSKWNIFLCMETPETWLNSFEKIPIQMPELKSVFKPLPLVRDFQNNS
ncbi:MAG: radical SAM protein [Pseudobdellovibrio sp.]